MFLCSKGMVSPFLQADSFDVGWILYGDVDGVYLGGVRRLWGPHQPRPSIRAQQDWGQWRG